jgi:hypothetical protein
VKNGDCVPASTADCQLSDLCKERGKCAYDVHCIAKSDEDCKGSNECKRRDHCIAKDGECVFSAKTCKGSAWCKSQGACAARSRDDTERACEPGTDAHCRQSEDCRERGDCKMGYVHGYPQPLCVAATDALCRKSKGCKKSGDCTVVTADLTFQVKVCGPSKEDHCKQSTSCKDDRLCRLHKYADDNRHYCGK